MNKNQHRIIFNACRGIRMAVAETATSQGKSASGESCGAAKSIAGVGTGFASLAFSLGAAVLLHASLLAPGAMAQVVADKSAPGNQQPTVLQTASGVTQINIQTPSAGGVSRNAYSQFDVPKKGVILNNGRTDSNTQLSGFVESNPWLAAGSARVILNEVNSSNPSQLNGFVEVAGQRAEVIIANPSGISVNGGGFLNASAVTLTTGTAVVNGGNLESYRVRGGVVTIEGAGLNTSTVDYTNILARATQVNAGIWAKDLKIVTGVNQIDASNAANPAVIGSAGVASDATPAFALDVAQLGGMYAGKIFLLGTEAGLGVRNSGVVGATAGDVTVSNNGWLSNSGTLSAVGSTRISAQGDVTNTGDLVATDTTSISSTGTLTNKGLIDSGNVAGTGQTQIDAVALSNIGTGRIYGDTISIAATTLTNDAEGTATATLAARQRLDIGVGTLNNLNGSNILSLEDMVIGGSLDANRQATGSATTVTNSASTIEAQGALTLKSAQINNLNPLIEWLPDAGTTGASGTVYFTPQGTFDSAQGASLATAEPLVGMSHGGYAYQHVEYFPSEVCSGGHEYTCTPTGPLVPFYTYAQGQVLPDGTSGATTFSGFATYTQTNYKAVITKSTPARIASGGDMTLVASQGIVNDQSAIVAGGALTITAPSVDNRARTITLNAVRNGTAYSWGRYDEGCGNVKGCNYDYQAYRPGAYQSTVSSTQVLDISVSKSASTDALSSQGTTLPVTSGASLPSGSLYRIQSSPSATVLVQTDPRFTNYKTWLGSDYMTSRISLDPSVTQKRLGDGFYEQQLIREQVAKLTGNRFLANYTSDQQQYQTLMDAGLTYANTYQLRPGISLSAAQVAQLTSDIVWLQQETITLADGTTTQALVPHVYMAVRTGDLAPSGALLGGNTVAISTTGDLTNSGTILGRQLVQIDANTINNLMGQIQAKNVVLNAVQDINNVGGTVLAQDMLVADAGRDINVTSTTQSTSGSAGNYSFSQSGIDRVAGLYVTGPGILLASAGKDLNLSAAQIASAGSVQFQSGGDINLKTVQQSVTNNFGAGNADNHLLTGQSTELGTQINATGNATLRAGKDVNAKAANVQAGADLEVSAGNNVNISAGQKTTSYDRAEKKSTSDLFSSTTTTQRDTTTTQSAVASNFGGTNVTVTSQNDLKVKASNVNAVQNATLVAGNNVSFEAAQNSQTSSSFYKKSETGFSVDTTNGPGVTTSDQSQNGKSSTTTDVGSTIRSGANLTVVAGNSIGGTAATLQAGGTANLSAQGNIVLQEGRTTHLAELQQKRNDQHIFSGTETQRRATQDTSTALASKVSGTQGVTMQANQGTLYLSDVKVDSSAGNVTLRGADVILASALNSSSQTFEEKTSRSGATINDVMATFQPGDGLGHERKDTVDDAHTTLAQGSVSGQNVGITSTGGTNNQLALRAVEVSATGTPATPGTITLDAGAGTLKLQTIQTSDSHAVSMTESDWAWQGKSGSGKQTQSTADTQLNGQLSTTAGSVQVEGAQTSLKEAAAQLATQPGMAWLDQLYNDPQLAGKVDWNKIDEIHKSWHYDQAGLTPAGATILAIVVTYFTAGAASGAATSMVASAGMTGATAAMASTALAAGMTALASQAAVAMVNNKGDIGKTLDQLGSQQSIQNLLTTMVTAGALQGLNASLFPGTEVVGAAGAKTFGSTLLKNLTNNLASTAIDSAINGKPFDEATLSGALVNAFISTSAAQAANAIGTAATATVDVNGITTPAQIDQFAQLFAHAALGCAVGAAKQATCGAGALGAVVGELAAQMFDPNGTGVAPGGGTTQQFAGMLAAVATAFTGGDPAQITIAQTAATNAVENNFLIQAKMEARNKALVTLRKDNDKSFLTKLLYPSSGTAVLDAAKTAQLLQYIDTRSDALLTVYRSDPRSLSDPEKIELAAYLGDYAKGNGVAAAQSLLRNGPSSKLDSGDVPSLMAYAQSRLRVNAEQEAQGQLGTTILSAAPGGAGALIRMVQVAQSSMQLGTGMALVADGEYAAGTLNMGMGLLGIVPSVVLQREMGTVGPIPKGASGGVTITNDVLVETRIGNGTQGQGSGNKVDQLPSQQVVGADGKPIPVYELKPNGPYATQEFPSTPIAHGFPDIVDNYASSATKFPLNNGASLYQALGSYNGVAGRFEWIVDPNFGGVTHRMFVPNGAVNGIPVKP